MLFQSSEIALIKQTVFSPAQSPAQKPHRRVQEPKQLFLGINFGNYQLLEKSKTKADRNNSTSCLWPRGLDHPLRPRGRGSGQPHAAWANLVLAFWWLSPRKDSLCCRPHQCFPAMAAAAACVCVNGFYGMIWMMCNILKQIWSKAQTVFFKEYCIFFFLSRTAAQPKKLVLKRMKKNPQWWCCSCDCLSYNQEWSVGLLEDTTFCYRPCSFWKYCCFIVVLGFFTIKLHGKWYTG